MADSGHDGTEEILKEIEKRVTKEYRQAAAEVQAKLNDYWRRFRIKDEIKMFFVFALENALLNKIVINLVVQFCGELLAPSVELEVQ